MKPRVLREASALDRLGQCTKAVTGRELDRVARTRFERYLELIQLWNRTHNLTGLRTPHEIVHGLFEDSLLFLPLLPEGSGTVVDIGAGAGIPGLPLAIVDERLRMVMVESRRKRVSFLRSVCRELEIGGRVSVEEGRAEAIVSDVVARFGLFDVALSRAVATTGSMQSVAMPFLRHGGVLISSGPPLFKDTQESGVRIVDFPELGLKRAFFVQQRRDS